MEIKNKNDEKKTITKKRLTNCFCRAISAREQFLIVKFKLKINFVNVMRKHCYGIVTLVHFSIHLQFTCIFSYTI